MAKKTKILRRRILDELEVGGARYALCFEYLPARRVRAVIYHRPRASLSDRVRNRAVWKQRPHKPPFGYLPYGYELWHSEECCEGRKALFTLGAGLVAGTRTTFRIRGGWQPTWQELRCGDSFSDTISTWRQRALGLLKFQLGDRTTNNEPLEN
jgi:hypothetical protein